MLRVPLASLVLLCAACDSPPEHVVVSRAIHDAELPAGTGHPWPLTVEAGYASCEGGRLAVFETMDGKKYAVAGARATVARSGYPPIEELQADDPTSTTGAKLTLQYLQDRTVRTCGPASLAP